MAEPHLSLKRLEVFCLVVENGGVTRAAELLLIAQPAVSAQIRSLESWFGAPLFVRHSGRLRTTEAGDRAYEWAKQTLARSASIRRYVQELAVGGAGRLVVVASLGLGTYLIPPILTRLRAERPGVDITLHTAQPEQAMRAVEGGEADFAIVTWYEQVMPNTLTVESLRDEPVVLWASQHGQPAEDHIGRDALADLSFVAVPSNVALGMAVDSQMHALGVGDLDVVIRLGHAESMKEAVRRHGWVTLLPNYSVDAEHDRLRAITVEGLSLHEPIVLVRRHDHVLSPFQSAALDSLRADLAARPSDPDT